MTSGHPIVVRRAEPRDAEAIHATLLGPGAIAGTLQLPYPSVEAWRKRISEFGFAIEGTCKGLRFSGRRLRRRVHDGAPAPRPRFGRCGRQRVIHG
jgi:hypothetical protein